MTDKPLAELIAEMREARERARPELCCDQYDCCTCDEYTDYWVDRAAFFEQASVRLLDELERLQRERARKVIMSKDAIDAHIDNFLASFRASARPFTPLTEPCIECGSPATTYCENCEAALCDDHANSERYCDVDVCLSDEHCEARLSAKEIEGCDA